jgi:hypothetical protein
MDSNFFKVKKTSFKLKRANSRTGIQLGGSLPTLIFEFEDKLAGENFLRSKKEWSVAIQSDSAVIPTLFYLRPKHHNKNQHSRMRKDKFVPNGFLKACPNFDKKLSLAEVVAVYCPDWEVRRSPSKNIQFEFDATAVLIEDQYSKRGLILLCQQKDTIQTLSYVSTSKNSELLSSILRGIARIGMYQDALSFINTLKLYVESSNEESDLVQKRDDLARLGIECFFKRKGVDSPGSVISILSKTGKRLEYNIDIELKHDAARFFTAKEASNQKKYGRLPTLIVANLATNNLTQTQSIIHPVICLKNLLQDCSLRKIDISLKTISIQGEISRLQQQLQELSPSPPPRRKTTTKKAA